jgi:hypothetical protein
MLGAAHLSSLLATKSKNEFQRFSYESHAAALTEVAYKESKPININNPRFHAYGFQDKAVSLILYSAILAIGAAPSSQGLGLLRAKAIEYYIDIARTMKAQPDKHCFVAGSIRREKQFIGDIDIILLQEYA